PNTTYSWISVCTVPDKGQVVRNQCRADPELCLHTVNVPDGFVPAVYLNDTVIAHALSEVLVRSPNAYFLDASIVCGDECGRGQSGVRFELDHGPDCHAHAGEAFLQRLKLSKQCRIYPLAGLVPSPQVIAEGFNDMVGGDTQVRRSLLNHLQHTAKYSNHRPE